MPDEHDMDEPVNTDMEPEEALRTLLGEQRHEDEPDVGDAEPADE
jgi:hypothetical protein